MGCYRNFILNWAPNQTHFRKICQILDKMSVVPCNLVQSRTFVRKPRKGNQLSTVTAQIHPMSQKRRARLARTLFVLSALVIMIATLIFNQSASAVDQAPTEATAFNYVSVMPGESLWQLAETYANGESQQDWVAEVILLNNLQSADLVAGDMLALP